MDNKSVAICILNYNGHNDTIECLKSIFKHEDILEYTILVMDNGSTKESVHALKLFLEDVRKNTKIKTDICILENLSGIDLKNNDLLFIQSKENHGFAVGNNFMAREAIIQGYQYIVFLNNDTEFIMPSISHLKSYMDIHPEYGVTTSNIVYYDNPDSVWNAGGELFFGTRKYNKNKEVNAFSKDGLEATPVTFITGCFMMIRKSVLENYGMFTDLFFFGEEDYDFCLRMKENKINMSCLLTSKIYHKVGATRKIIYNDEHHNRRLLCYYANRFINMKNHYSKFQWNVWRILSSIFITVCLTFKRKQNFIQAVKFVNILNKFSNRYNGVNKNLYTDIMSGKYL